MSELSNAIVTWLGRNGVAARATLQRELGVTQPTLSRALGSLGDSIVRVGGGRSTRYGLRRTLPRIGGAWPLFSVNANGEPKLIGRLHALARDQYWVEAPLGDYPRLSDGLPFFLQDLVPEGFIGRTVPHRFPELGLPERVTDWTDDHVLTYLCQRGEDCIGNLILGDESLQRFLRHSDENQIVVDAGEKAQTYARLADAAIAGSVPGSSAGGEHPKFTTTLQQGSLLQHVLVKFSPSGTDRFARRWSDLLICEHIATHVLKRAGLTATTSALVMNGGRTFLESPRFDRTGLRGRTGLVSLAALSNEYRGTRDNWIAATRALATLGVISREDAEKVRRLATFGRLIANTDMHSGNISFHLEFDRPPALAPVYDMLPMFYAPTAGDVAALRDYDLPLPSGDNLDIWGEMADLAVSFWAEVAAHEAVSGDFATQARRNAQRIAGDRTVPSH